MTIIEVLKKQKLEIQKQILEIQSQCSHPLAAREYANKGNSGNYDPSSDHYWTEHKCRLCEFQWRSRPDWDSVGDKRGMPDN